MTAAIMGYPQTSIGVVGITNAGLVLDNTHGNLYGVNTSGGPSGIRKWDIWPQGLERRARNNADLGVTLAVTGSTQTYNSNEVVLTASGANSGALYGFLKSDLTYSGTFGVVGASGAASTTTRILSAFDVCCFQGPRGQDIILANTVLSTQELNHINWGAKVNLRTTITESQCRIGALPDGSGTEAWAFGFGATCTLYRITYGANTPIGTPGFAPSFIDPTWTTITNTAGISVDQADGCPIVALADGFASQSYLVKFNRVTGAIMWKVLVGTGGLKYTHDDMSKNVIANSTLYYFGTATNTLFTINTATGAFTTQTISDVGVSSQMSEDVSGTKVVNGVKVVGGSVVWYGNWSEVNTHPTYLGNYCLTLGNHSGSDMCWRCWPNGTPDPAPVYAVAVNSRKRAWSFTLDGHTFYVLDLGSQGTWVYDKLSGQWAQFVTEGYAQWNFANGCMWGQRIVAGDMVTTDMWEMNPSALFDNGAAEITHVVTGGVITRSRTYHSVDSFYLACSPGLLQDGGAASNVTLSFSDDQGHTWTDMDTLTLLADDWSAEIAWTSLGSFAAPGRIFKITDVGGFMRISGADAGINDFDPVTGAREE